MLFQNFPLSPVNVMCDCWSWNPPKHRRACFLEASCVVCHYDVFRSFICSVWAAQQSGNIHKKPNQVQKVPITLNRGTAAKPTTDEQIFTKTETQTFSRALNGKKQKSLSQNAFFWHCCNKLYALGACTGTRFHMLGSEIWWRFLEGFCPRAKYLQILICNESLKMF